MAVLSSPADKKAQRTRKRAIQSYTFRCYFVSHKPDEWVGECIDLDIAVQAKTSEETRQKLEDAIFGYLDLAFSSDDFKNLIPRPSPWSHRAFYRFLCLRGALTKSRDSFRISDCSSSQLLCA
jgi:hypothetical protein